MTHKAALVTDWLVFFYFQYGKNKDHAKEGDEKKTSKVKTRAEVHVAPVEPPALAEPPVPDVEVPPTPAK